MKNDNKNKKIVSDLIRHFLQVKKVRKVIYLFLILI